MSVKEIAKLAGVSVATVSRVLNNSATVKKSTSEKVSKIINDLGYQPNILARQLRTSKTSMILVVCSDISNPFIAGVLKSIENNARKAGYRTIFSSTNGTPLLIDELLNLTASKTIEGVISLDEISMHPDCKKYCNGIPWVLCGETSDPNNFSSVSIDDDDAAYTATKTLLESGKKKIALISQTGGFSYANKRQRGYERAVEESGYQYKNTVYADKISFKEGMAALEELFTSPNPPDAIVAVSDILAIGATQQAKKRGIEIPEKLAIIGFDDIPIAEMVSPALSTIHQPAQEMGRIAVELLVQQLTLPGTPNKAIQLEWTFVKRGTH
ncbi:TPA: LacI family DNA-binding transcriptional regulator [Citrobacter freundii]|uniref:LacI family DNA-binding transcriptional regulator n=1 Tax=Enterobacter roggenkampii TaxID=1812935 RepID=UPI00254BE133|nr:LacI family DNA-binding transcriptional regulator [Enterobacter roggenkampii]MDK4549230.1 LacI family DNA-binding transcriptional regulator [Enterobacter roggenkampii]